MASRVGLKLDKSGAKVRLATSLDRADPMGRLTGTFKRRGLGSQILSSTFSQLVI